MRLSGRTRDKRSSGGRRARGRLGGHGWRRGQGAGEEAGQGAALYKRGRVTLAVTQTVALGNGLSHTRLPVTGVTSRHHGVAIVGRGPRWRPQTIDPRQIPAADATLLILEPIPRPSTHRHFSLQFFVIARSSERASPDAIAILSDQSPSAKGDPPGDASRPR